jgi:hypothetical protein
MARTGSVRRFGVGLAALLSCTTLAACSGTNGFEAPRESTFSLSSIGNLVAFNKLFPKEAPLTQTEGPVDCPTIEVQDGTASIRVYNGSEDNAHVRYAFALGDIARECSRNGNQLVLKIGAEGRVLLGPAGSAGSFTVPLRFAVRDDNSQKILTSQLVRIPASIPAGETQTDFSFVSEPFSVPLVPHPDEDYVILVGFDAKGQGTTAEKPRTKRRHR